MIHTKVQHEEVSSSAIWRYHKSRNICTIEKVPTGTYRSVSLLQCSLRTCTLMARVCVLQVAAKQSRLDALRASNQALQEQLLAGPQAAAKPLPVQVGGEGLL